MPTFAACLYYAPTWSQVIQAARTAASHYLHWIARRPARVPNDVKSQFETIPNVAAGSLTMTGQNTNSTDVPALYDSKTMSLSRAGASVLFDTLAQTLALEPVYLQGSAADENAGRLYTRNYHWIRDVEVTPASVKLTDEHLRVLVDVDYHLDMPDLLARDFAPHALYSIVPERVAGDGAYAFTFVPPMTGVHDEIVVSVAGGHQFRHSLWNHSVDTVSVSSNLLCCIGMRSAVYDVKRRHVDGVHALVLYIPVVKYEGCLPVLVSRMMSARPLERLRVNRGAFNVLYVHREDGMHISVGRVGTYDAAVVPVLAMERVLTIARTSSVKLTPQEVRTMVDDKAKALVVRDYSLSIKSDRPVSVVYPQSHSYARYQFHPDLFDPEAKASVVPFMPPVALGAYAPDKTVGNNAQAIIARVEKLAESPEPELTPFLYRVISEFVDHCVPDAIKHTFEPVEAEVVFANQPRPAQQAILQSSLNLEDGDNATMMMKSESYGDAKDPRAITTPDPSKKMHLSQLSYAMQTLFKDLPFYAFGHTPREQAERVAEIATSSDEVVTPDLSRFDGRVRRILHLAFLLLNLRLFKREYHTQIKSLLVSLIGMKVWTKASSKHHEDSLRYFLRSAWASGVPQTSQFGTFANALILYTAARMTRLDGHFMDAAKAWIHICKKATCGGDDAVVGDLTEATLVKAAASYGQVIECVVFRRGEKGINFLNRIFGPDVWNGDPNSHRDIARAIVKFHLTTQTLATPEQILLEKGRDYALSDWNTPVLGDIARAVVSIVGGLPDASALTREVAGYTATVVQSEQFPNRENPWMIDDLKEQMPDFDVGALRAFLATCVSLKDFQRMPVCSTPPPSAVKEPVIVNGELHLPSVTTASKYVVDKKKDGTGYEIKRVEDGVIQLEPSKDKFAELAVVDQKWVLERVKSAKGKSKDDAVPGKPDAADAAERGAPAGRGRGGGRGRGARGHPRSRGRGRAP